MHTPILYLSLSLSLSTKIIIIIIINLKKKFRGLKNLVKPLSQDLKGLYPLVLIELARITCTDLYQ